MKNLLIVAPGIILNKSVASIRMISLIRYLDNFDYNIYIVTTEKDEKVIYNSSKIKYFFVDDILETSGMASFKHNREAYAVVVKELINSYKIDSAIVSMGPFYTYKLASLFKNNNIRAIMDFRDPWVFDIRDKKAFFNIKNFIALTVKIPMERSCVHSASEVVTVTEGWINTFKWFYPFEKNKFVLIKNGYDDVVLDNIDFPVYEKKQGSKLSIGVFGKLFYYTEEYSQIFLEGVREFVDCCNVIQIGEREECIDKLLNKNDISLNFIESTGFITYDEGMKKLSGLDVYMIIDCRKDAIGTKIYDYIYFGKPIIYIGLKESAIALTVAGLGNSFVCSTAEEVKNALEKLIGGDIKINEKSKNYSRTEQNKLWKVLIDKEKL